MADKVVSAELAYSCLTVGTCSSPAGEGIVYRKKVGILCNLEVSIGGQDR